MLQRSITLTVWALVGWTAMVLGLRLLPQPLQAPAGTQALAAEAPPPARLERLFGSAPVATGAVVSSPAAGERFRLLGVVAPRQSQLQTREGVALLSVDGGPPKAFRVGQLVDGHLRLLAVEALAVGLGEAGVVQIQLSLQPPPAAATGSLNAAPPLVQPAVPVQVPATANPPPPVQAHPTGPLPPAQRPGSELVR